MAKKRDGVREAFYDPFNPRRKASSQQQDIEWILERTMLELAVNRFEWKNMPEEVDVRWMEMQINLNGLAVFFKEPNDGMFRAMQGTPHGPLNLIGQNIEYRVLGGMGYTRDLSISECVPIWCNYTRIPDIDKIRMYARRIAKMDRSIEINADNARRTKYIRANEHTRLSVENLNRLIEQGAPFLPIVDEADPNTMLETIDLGVDPNTIVNLHMLRTREWGEIMNLLGINTANQDKKERLVASETAANDDVVQTLRRTNLNAREQAAERINKMFKLTIEVDYYTDDTTADQQVEDQEQGPALKAVNS